MILTIFSGEHLILIMFAVILLFGGKKIPEFMKGIGEGIKEFKKATNDEEQPSSSASSNKVIEKE